MQLQLGADSLALIAKAVICAIPAIFQLKGDNSVGKLAHSVRAGRKSYRAHDKCEAQS